MCTTIRSLRLSFVGILLLLPAAAQAAPISMYTPFGAWQSALPGGHDNVLFNNIGNYPLNVVTNPSSPFTVTGHINGTTGVGTFPTNGLYVDISGIEQLTAGTGGQADVEPNDGSTSQMTITPNPANGLAGFNAIAFKIEYPGAGSLSHALTLQVFYDGVGTGSNTFNVTQGKNEFYGFIADPGYFITSVAIVSSDDFSHLQQIRVQGVGRDPNKPSDDDDPTVPEPSTIALFGVMLAIGAGCFFYRRLRSTAAVV